MSRQICAPPLFLEHLIKKIIYIFLIIKGEPGSTLVTFHLKRNDQHIDPDESVTGCSCVCVLFCFY